MCIFCKIVKGEIPSHKIYEDDSYIAILDVSPVVEGHTLLIPKFHVETIFGLTDEQARDRGYAELQVVKKLEKVYGANIEIRNTSGKGASQEVMHLHYHLIPRKIGDRLWDGDKSRNVLDKSSGFERLKMTKEELEVIVRRLN